MAGSNTSEGYIKVYRNLLSNQHELHSEVTGEPMNRWGAWIDMIGLAAWRDHSGLKRGQFFKSCRGLAERWNWSPDRVSRFLRELESEGRIARQVLGGRKATRVTICNYDKYQQVPDASKDATVDATEDIQKEEEQEEVDTEDAGASSADQDQEPNIAKRAQALLGYWIDQQPTRPDEAEIRKQGAVVNRLVTSHSLENLRLAVRGIVKIYPYSGGEPWDFFDLERKFAKAMAAGAANTGNGKGSKHRTARDYLEQFEREDREAGYA